MAFKGIIYDRPGQGMRVRPNGGEDQSAGAYIFDQMNQGDVSGLVNDLMQPGSPMASAGMRMSAPPSGQMVVAGPPMQMADRSTGEDYRRGYSAGNVSANELRAGLGFNDPMARRARFQIAETTGRQLADRADERRTGAALAMKRMELQADMMRPIPLGGSGGVAQMQSDGTLKVVYPPARPQAADPVKVGPGETVLDPNTGRPIFSAPAASPEPRIIPPGAMMVQPGQPPVVNPQQTQERRAEPYYGPAFMDEQTGMLRTWNPRGGQYGEGGYDVKSPKAGGTLELVDGKLVQMGDATSNKLPLWSDRQRVQFLEQFKAQHNREPSPAEMERAKGKYW